MLYIFLIALIALIALISLIALIALIAKIALIALIAQISFIVMISLIGLTTTGCNFVVMWFLCVRYMAAVNYETIMKYTHNFDLGKEWNHNHWLCDHDHTSSVPVL